MNHPAPDTPLIREALQLAQHSLPQTIFRHSQRTFLLGRAYARARRIAFEEEDLLLAALFHDLGLSDAYADRRRAFTEIGGTLVEEFLTSRGDAGRGRVLAEAIDLHMQLLPRWSHGPIAGLLQVGAWMDASRLRAGQLRAQIREIEAQLPREGFDAEFRARLLRSFGSFRACVRVLSPAARGG